MIRHTLFLAFFLFLAINCSSIVWVPNLYNEVSFGDNFTDEERYRALIGFNLWKRETGCKVDFVEVPDGGIRIRKATDEEMARFDREQKKKVVGLAVKNVQVPFIYFVFQRINSLDELELVAAHEAGHHLGMEHVPQNQIAIMNPSLNNALINDQHLTSYDMDQFDSYWRCR
jgi:hypothetical protein